MAIFDFLKEIKTIRISDSEILDNSNNRQNKSDIPTKFNLNCIKQINKSTYYLLCDKADIQAASDDIIALNKIISQAHNIQSRIPKRIIKHNHLCFQERVINGTNCYNFIEFSSLSKTGKLSKYLISLIFNVNENLFGNIGYLQNGQVGKAEITLWTKSDCFIITASQKENDLSLNKIYEVDSTTGKRIKIFDSKQ